MFFGDYEKAEIGYKKLYSKNENNTEILSKLIDCYYQNQKYDIAESLIKDKLKDNNIRFYFLHVLLGYGYSLQDHKEKANIEYIKAIRKAEGNMQISLSVGSVFAEKSMLNKALLVYNKALELGNTSLLYSNIALIYAEKGNLKMMINNYLEQIMQDHRTLDRLFNKISPYLSRDSNDSVNLFLKNRVIAINKTRPKAFWNKLLSKLYIYQKQYQEAFLQEKIVYFSSENIHPIFNLGEICFKSDEFTISENCFNFISSQTRVNSSFNIKSSLYLLEIDVKNKKDIFTTDSKYLKMLKEVKALSNKITVSIAYSDFLFNIYGKQEEAISVLKPFLDKKKINNSDLLTIKMKLADYYVLYGDFDKAMFFYLQIKESSKLKELKNQAIFKQARLAFFKNDFKWAKSAFASIKMKPSQWEANNALDYYLLFLDCYEDDLDDQTHLSLYSEAIYNIHCEKYDKALIFLKELISLSKGFPIEIYAVYQQAESLEKLGNWNQSVSSYLYLLNTYPQNNMADKSCYKLAEIYNYELKDYEKAKEYYKKILSYHIDSIYLEEARSKYRILNQQKPIL